jgi:hypothetical protein
MINRETGRRIGSGCSAFALALVLSTQLLDGQTGFSVPDGCMTFAANSTNIDHCNGLGRVQAYTGASPSAMAIQPQGTFLGVGSAPAAVGPVAPLQVYKGAQNYTYPQPGQTVGAIHLSGASNPVSTTNYVVDTAITFGGPSLAPDGTPAGYFNTALSGIYSRAYYNGGAWLYFATTDDFNAGSKVRMTLDQAGNAGIGTMVPTARLHVVGSTPGNPGQVLVGDDGGFHPTLSLYKWGGSGTSYWVNRITTSNTTGTNDGSMLFQLGGTSAPGTADSFTTRMMIDSGGSVGIGTTTPCANSGAPAKCLLAVNGGIEASEVVVTNAITADYVFAPGYRLAPLSEVAEYVKANRHLPEIPSAAEVAEKGVNVADMQAKLLAKIEELTLHMIAAEERAGRLEKENSELRDRVGRLEGK